MSLNYINTRKSVIEVESSQRLSVSQRDRVPDFIDEWEENVDLAMVCDPKGRSRKSTHPAFRTQNSDDLILQKARVKPHRPSI